MERETAMIRCEQCNLLIQDGTQIPRRGLCPWCWDEEYEAYDLYWATDQRLQGIER